MNKPSPIIRYTSHTFHEIRLPAQFGILCWNVQKRNLGGRFQHFFAQLLENSAIDLLAFQEVKLNLSAPRMIEGFFFSCAPNIRLFRHAYGVLNGARIHEKETFALLSSHREGMIRTRKSAICSSYSLSNGDTILMLNLHAINFRETSVYCKEIERIFESVRHHRGPMIVAGDFNSWNKERMGFVMRKAEEMGLQQAEPECSHLIKCFREHRLDHIFFRGLRLSQSRVVDVGKLSDHNALYASFETL